MRSSIKVAKLITDFFEKDNYRHGHFEWDGSDPTGSFTIGQAGANAVATYALLGEDSYKDLVKKVLQKAWDAKPITGNDRYYDGLVHYLAMLHLTGNFKIWKPKPKDVKEKTEPAGEYNGATYKEGDTIDAFEDCELYKITFVKAAEPPKDSTDSTDALRNLDMRIGKFKMERNYNLKGCKVNSEKAARGAYYGRIVPVK